MFVAAATATAVQLPAGDHTRTLEVDGRQRSYLVHVPESVDHDSAAPVVLVFHGFGANSQMMVGFSGMSEKADEAGFLAVYPQAMGIGFVRAFNAGTWNGQLAEAMPDDVAFVDRLLDDLAGVAHIDPRRVYATGMSNGGMMCYRLAQEMPDRIAAIAAVAGTMAVAGPPPERPMPVLHFHGTADTVVAYEGPSESTREHFAFLSVEETVRFWVRQNACQATPVSTPVDDRLEDSTTVTRVAFVTAKQEERVVLYRIEGGGHTWPGREPPPLILGRSTREIDANDLMWSFFQRYQLP
jgi:polyhydroxybutyrate depolymerase